MQHLYHFTSKASLANILQEGLKLSPGAGHPPQEMIWLATSPSSWGHGLNTNKREATITVDTIPGDPALVSWTDWASETAHPTLIEAVLDDPESRAGRTWVLGFRPILPSEFVAVEIRDPDDFDNTG